jgi:hypothetical protein
MFLLLLDSDSQILFTLCIVVMNGIGRFLNRRNYSEANYMHHILESKPNTLFAVEPDKESRTDDAFQRLQRPLVVHRPFFAEPIVSRDDLSFTHSIFVQCFLPLRPLTAPNNQRWEVTHGSASLSIEAGRLADPHGLGRWDAREVPAGPKARLLFAYINDFAIRHKTPVIDLGKSLRAFMEINRVPIGGPNGQEITRQLKNIAAARIVLGIWSETRVSTRQSRVAAGIDFWRDRNAGQNTFWEPEMQLAPEYFEELSAHRVPLYFPALVKLQANPRAMDVFCWLVYRMRSVGFPVKIPYAALHPVFGGGLKLLKHFKIEFRNAMMAVHESYPQARVELHENHLTLHRSPSLIPPGT